VTTAHGGSSGTAVDDPRSLDTEYLPHYQVYRGMSPNSANRLEVGYVTFLSVTLYYFSSLTMGNSADKVNVKLTPGTLGN